MKVKKNALEWTVFGSGLVVVFGLASYLGYLTWTAPSGNAMLRSTILESRSALGGFQTRVRVENVCEEAAIAPKVDVDGVAVDLDYVPRHSNREVCVVTKRRPKEARVLGWQTP